MNEIFIIGALDFSQIPHILPLTNPREFPTPRPHGQEPVAGRPAEHGAEHQAEVPRAGSALVARPVQHAAQLYGKLRSRARRVQERGLRLDLGARGSSPDFHAHLRAQSSADRRRAGTSHVQPERVSDAEKTRLVHDGRPAPEKRGLGEPDGPGPVQDRRVDERLPGPQVLASVDVPRAQKRRRIENAVRLRLLPRTRRPGPARAGLFLRTAENKAGAVRSAWVFEISARYARIRAQPPAPGLRDQGPDVPEGQGASASGGPESGPGRLRRGHARSRARRPRGQHVLTACVREDAVSGVESRSFRIREFCEFARFRPAPLQCAGVSGRSTGTRSASRR